MRGLFQSLGASSLFALWSGGTLVLRPTGGTSRVWNQDSGRPQDTSLPVFRKRSLMLQETSVSLDLVIFPLDNEELDVILVTNVN